MEIKSKKEHFEKLFADMSKGYMTAKAEADRQRAMGKHDYNIFTLFHGFSDEVNLHSNFIASLLDPNGDHYKGDLFLKLFLEMCDIDDFSIDMSTATVFKEFKHIDIYISDGKKHIILENKVYAKDQPTQIARYIETIIQNKDAEDEDIYVLYLHPDGDLPKEYSLGDYKTNQDETKLVKKGSTINFKVISYEDEISNWIDKCKNEVSNITDLNVFLSQYKDVIEMIYNRYKRIDKMEKANLVEVFKENYAAVLDIVNNHQEVRKEIINEFFKNLSKELEKIYPEENSYKVGGEEVASNKYCQPIKIESENWKLFNFAIEFTGANLTKPIMGFVKKDKTIDLSKIDNTKNSDDFWIESKEISGGDICKSIVAGGFENILLKNIKDFISEYDEKISSLKQN